MFEQPLDHVRYLAMCIAVGLALAAAISAFGWRYRRSISRLVYAGGELPSAIKTDAEMAAAQSGPAAPLVVCRIKSQATVLSETAKTALAEAARRTQDAKRCHLLAGAVFWAAIVLLQAWSFWTTQAKAAWPLFALHASLPGLVVCAAIVAATSRAWVLSVLAYLALTVVVTSLVGWHSGRLVMAGTVSIGLLSINVPLGIGILLLMQRHLSSLLIFMVPSVLFMLLPMMAMSALLNALGQGSGLEPIWSAAIVLAPLVVLFLVSTFLPSQPGTVLRRLGLWVAGAGVLGVAMDTWLEMPMPFGPLVLALPTLVLLGASFKALLGSQAASRVADLFPPELFQMQVCWLTLAMLAWVVVGWGGPGRPSGSWSPGQTLVLPAYAMGLALHIHLLRGARRVSGEFRPKRLLLLRVFQARQKRERLLDKLSDTWRRVGCIDLPGGPDLAMRTLSFANWRCFVLDRLDSRFCRDKAELGLRLAVKRDRMDMDLRYPVNDVYCYGGVWQLAVQRLARQADVVLLDLRGFTLDNTGCAIELAYLIRYVALSKVLILVDSTTDEHALREVVQVTWRSLPVESPNVSTWEPTLRLAAVDDIEEAQALTNELFVIAFGSKKDEVSQGTVDCKPRSSLELDRSQI